MSPPDDPIELHLPDGGHVIVAFEDAATRLGEDGDEFVDTLLHADGSERDVERAIRTQAEGLGLGCYSTSQHPTRIVIRRS